MVQDQAWQSHHGCQTRQRLQQARQGNHPRRQAGGGSPDTNARLRSAITAAKAANVPNDNIDRAIKKGTGELAGAALEEILYEAYAPGGVAMMIEIVTDNRNRSANDIRVLLSKNNGTFADSGSVAYMFQRRGEIRLDKPAATEDQIMEVALEAGADDIQDDGDDWVVYTATDKLFQVANGSCATKARLPQPEAHLPAADHRHHQRRGHREVPHQALRPPRRLRRLAKRPRQLRNRRRHRRPARLIPLPPFPYARRTHRRG
jgi:YebC/PmpR family DNA-binding regulatory protein